jgi:putative transposase
MALSKSALSDLLDALRAAGDLDLVGEALVLVLIDAEATQHIGARPFERTERRTAHRNGTRARSLPAQLVTDESDTGQQPPRPAVRQTVP